MDDMEAARSILAYNAAEARPPKAVEGEKQLQPAMGVAKCSSRIRPRDTARGSTKNHCRDVLIESSKFYHICGTA